ncbi:adenylate cyclase [Tistlia consotensis]|uniref:Adenylate cyclase n=1 Tax=Tistlia consotensis USBA 355 TaxID=560819 RepID=A0A1Y6B8Q1_9PROT|nr:adenylate/guanylate cyclase domain-containing protein [Tistlia consotensis]SME87808.1 adenylate cyclase [Tistlia consotensis USBA 355]SNR24172.1 adenylate cyclase [Tistlia consotensis]
MPSRAPACPDPAGAAPRGPGPKQRPGERPGDRRRRRLAVLAGGLLVALVATGGTWLVGHSGLSALEAQTLDWRFRLRGPIPPAPQIAVVTLDERSLGAAGGWPPRRGALAEAVERLHAAGAKAILLDLLLEQPETTLPEGMKAQLSALRRLLPDGSPGAAALDRLTATSEGDQRLRRAIAAAGDVVLPFALSFDRSGRSAAPGGALRDRAVARLSGLSGDQPAALSLHPGRLTLPEPSLLAAAAGLGHALVLLSGDGRPRRQLAALGIDGEFYLSAALEAVRLFEGGGPAEIDFGRGILLDGRTIPTDRQLGVLVNHTGADYPAWSFADLLAGKVPDAAFAGRLVVVGASAAVAGRGFATPYAANEPGHLLQAAIIDDALTGRFLKRGPLVVGLDLVLALAGGLLALAAGLALRPTLALPAVLLLLLAGFGAAYLLLVEERLWLGVLVPSAAVLAGGVWGATVQALAELARRRRVERERANLSRYFSPSLVETLAGRPDGPIARQQDAAVLFVDLVGFTARAEALPPERSLAELRRFHGLVEEAVFAEDGTLDKFLGDGALATFGVPDPRDDDAAHALAAARRIAEAAAAWRAEDPEAPAVAVGVHHGRLFLGDVGGRRRFEFTVIGDTVNVASRLEGLSRKVGAVILASDACVARARAAGPAGTAATEGFEALAPQPLRGRAEPVALWAWGRVQGAAAGATAST